MFTYPMGFWELIDQGVWPIDITYSALFDGSSDYLSFTPSSAGDRRTFTISGCVKYAGTSGGTLFNAWSADTNAGFTKISFLNNKLSFTQWSGGVSVQTDSLIIDQTGHFHFTIAVDTTEATAADRVKMWVNGVTQTVSGTMPSLNEEFSINSTCSHNVGRALYSAGSDDLLSGYVSSLYFVDGQALPASTWGEDSDLVTGLWAPKDPGSLTYGTNGCYLDFSNASALGEDQSGNNNDWTINGSPVQTLDTPTNNGCTWNPAWPGASLSNGNLSKTAARATSTFKLPSGKSAWKIPTVVAGGTLGLMYVDGTFPSGLYYLSMSAGSSYEFFFDADTGSLDYKVNGGALTNIDTLSLTKDVQIYCDANCTADFIDFTPSELGYIKLQASDRTDPTLLKSASVADLVLRNGTGAVATVSLPDMEGGPDLVVLKGRTGTFDWHVCDTQRGADHFLFTNLTNGDSHQLDKLTSFNVGGYTLGSSQYVNQNGTPFIDLCIRAGVKQGFEIIQYAGDGAAGRQLAHNLGKVPTFIIIKCISHNGTSWPVYHQALGATKGLFLDTTGAAVTASNLWNDTSPNATHITLGDNIYLNNNGYQYIAYVFTDSDIFKAFSYTGNGSTDGPFVNLDGRPLGVPFLKNSAIVSGWYNFDSARDPFNVIEQYLFPNASDAEGTSQWSNFTSQGFKVIGSGPGYNGSGNLFVGLAILESTKYSNAF